MLWTDALVKSPPRLKAAPASFNGSFADFFDAHVIPNLPPVERVNAFDKLLRAHFARTDPCYIVRKVRGLDRRTTHVNDHQLTLLAGDNSPGWYIHALLASDVPLPQSPESFFEIIPRHFHDARLRADLSKAGFHLAHLTNANNRDIEWRTWPREEAERRMTLNLHPWNWCLLAKSQWRKHGGRADILAFIDRAYAKYYGTKYTAWRLKFPIAASGERNPNYAYSSDAERPIKLSHAAARLPRTPGAERLLNRPTIRRDWSDCGITLDLNLKEGRFVVPHDALMRWAIETKNVAQTESWRRGVYSWPRPTADMLEFLMSYRRA